ncbi:MAG: dihydroorotase [Chloroflexi bacterium]|nr:dihydroorotase [Chloroflexota bacterium]
MSASAPPLHVRQGRIVDPATGFDGVADLLIREGRVDARGVVPFEPPADALLIEAAGKIVCPGFVDLHTHLRFPGSSQKETMASGTAAAAAGGFTTVCAMANTDPVVDSVEVLERVLEEARREAMVHVRQLAAVTVGLRGERLTDVAALARAGSVAFSDGGKPVRDGEIMRRALAAAAREGRAVSAHEEDPGLVGAGLANAGPAARRLGLPEWPCSGEASMVARDLALLERQGGHLHVAHVSCADTVALLRGAKERGLNVTAEVTPHHLRLTDRLLEGDSALSLTPAHPCTKVNPPLRSAHDVETLVGALADGVIDAVATDHAPHADADKALPYERAAFGISAIETALPLLLDLVRAGRIDLPTLISRLTVAPARIFGLDAGTLRPGARADVCIFDPDAVWQVSPEALLSKGKNTPLLGAQLRGRVVHTFVEGRIVHEGTASPSSPRPPSLEGTREGWPYKGGEGESS